MKRDVLVLVSFALCLSAIPQTSNTEVTELTKIMNDQKKLVTRWYTAFELQNPTLLDDLLAPDWVDIPPAPGQAPGPEGAKQILVQLGTTFSDLKIKIQEILQDDNKLVVRSTISGTQRAPFVGRPSKNRSMTIQAVDIHEVKNGRIIQTWHTEDWMSGLHQLGLLETH
jgi:steroid delta-isomerase-like uncharacterized protein